jgi:hypothetical protein
MCGWRFGWVTEFESLVERFEDAVQVPVGLSLLAVPVDGVAVRMGGRTETDRWEVVDIEQSNANAGKECCSPSGSVAKGGSEGNAGGRGTNAKSDRVGGAGTHGADLTDRYTGRRERGDDAAEFIAGGFEERSGELSFAEVKRQSDDGSTSGGVVVQGSRSSQVWEHNDRRWLRRRL